MKSIKFLFPFPSIIATVLLGTLLSKATVNGRAIAFSEWVIFMLVLFLVIIIPLNIVLYLLKRKKNNRNEGAPSHGKPIHEPPVNDKESQGISCYLKGIIPKSKMDPLFEESGI